MNFDQRYFIKSVYAKGEEDLGRLDIFSTFCGFLKISELYHAVPER
jgi:hypothetical protein